MWPINYTCIAFDLTCLHMVQPVTVGHSNTFNTHNDITHNSRAVDGRRDDVEQTIGSQLATADCQLPIQISSRMPDLTAAGQCCVYTSNVNISIKTNIDKHLSQRHSNTTLCPA